MNRAEELQAIQGGTVDAVREAIADTDSTDDLAALKALEEAGGSPRKGVLDAIDRRVAALSEPPVAVEAAPAEQTFRDADYDGPLTGEQAAWRNANLKPVGGVVTK